MTRADTLSIRIFLVGLGVALSLASPAGAAPLAATAGPYRVEVVTQPSPIPVGPVKIQVHLMDSAGKEVPGAAVQVLAQMPGMPMGERTEAASPVPGKPSYYVVPADFQMSGKWDITVEITGTAGKGKAVLHAATGMRTAGGAGIQGFLPLLLYLLGGLALLFLLVLAIRSPRMRQQIRRPANRGTLGGLLLLLAIYAGGRYAVAKYRRPGAMSVIEAQAMDMTVMKPPVGAVPVAVTKASWGSIDATVRYTGSVVPYQEQDAYPRVTGWIRWMPFYPGDRVKKGQLLARLDATELGSRVSERVASRTMAEHQHEIAQQEARQARAQVAAARGAVADSRQQRRRAQAAVRQTASELTQAHQDLVAAREERVQAEADLAAAQSGLADAEAGVSAARADQEYWRAEIQREAGLLKLGAVSQEEYQREKAQADNADARVRQAQAKLQETQSAIQGAQSKIRRADAMIAGATAKVGAAEARLEQSSAEVASAAAKTVQMQADLRATQAAAEAGIHRIAHTAAAVQEAQAQLNTASVVRDYTEIRSEVDGVVTQRLISPGVLVNPGMAILKIAQIDPIRLQANVAETDLASIRVGDRVRAGYPPAGRVIPKSPGRVVEAKVTAVFPAADPVARTGIVEAVVRNPDGRLRPGEYVVMEIATAHRPNTLKVPAGAVIQVARGSSDVLSYQEASAVWQMVAGKGEKPVYLCTMHPKESKSEKPGKCPI